MYKDKLVEEVRQRREELMGMYEFEVEKIYNMLKEREEKVKDKVVSQIAIVANIKKLETAINF